MNTRTFLPCLVAFVALFAPASEAQQPADALARERDQQTGTAITILFDNSGSMKGEKIRQAKAAFSTWLQNMPAEYKYSLITFEGKGRLDVPLGEHTRDKIAQWVAGLQAETSTPICGALKIAREQIEKRRREVTPYERHVVLIFTDGEENEDPRGIEGVRADIQSLRKLMVEVVGVGFHGAGDYMNGVATRFALADNEQELRKGLAKVDAEIGNGGDLVVSAADLAALKNFHAPPIQPISSLAVESTDVAASAPQPPSAASKRSAPHFNFGAIFAVVMIWLALRSVFGSKKKKAR